MNSRLMIRKENQQPSFSPNNMPLILEEIHVLKDHSPITELRVEKAGSESKLIVFSQKEIRAIPLFKCNRKAHTCSECVALQDPYCAWDTVKQQCSGSKFRYILSLVKLSTRFLKLIEFKILYRFLYGKRELFVQNIQFGFDNRCGNSNAQATVPNKEPINNNEESDDILIQSKTFYTSETFLISLICGILASLIIGFFVGLMSTKHFNKATAFRRPDEENSNICHYEGIADPRFGQIGSHQFLTLGTNLNLGTNSPNPSQINYGQNSKKAFFRNYQI